MSLSSMDIWDDMEVASLMTPKIKIQKKLFVVYEDDEDSGIGLEETMVRVIVI